MPPTTEPPTFAKPGPRPAAPPPPRKRRRTPWWIIAGGIVLIMIGGAALAVFLVGSSYIAGAPAIPSKEALWSVRRSPGMTFLDRNGQVIATRGAKYGQAITLAQLPAYVPKAFLAAEDRRFYQHGPVDFHAIARAIETNLKAKRSREGASTISQQLARTLFLNRDPSLKRKVQEAYIAWELEQSLSKDDILALYMNRSYFGDGAYGVDAASQTYFGKPASQLTLVEAATLAGLPNAPSRLALTNDLPAAVARARRILASMREENWITDADLAAANTQTPQLYHPSHTGEGDMSYILDDAAAEATQLTGGGTPDLVIRTTIDPVLEAAGVAAVRDVVTTQGAHRNVHQGAMVALAPDGAIVAMVGGLDHDQSAFNRVTQAHRQPGSSFKAFVYGAAMEHGLTPTTIRVDGPVSYGSWTPANYGHGYAGPVTLEQALARSLNTVSVRLTLEVGPSTVAEFARRLGVSDIPTDPGPSIALGAYEVTPLEMAAGYQVFQTGGGRTTPYLVSEVRSTRGDVLYAHADSAPTPVLDPLFATRMVEMLKKVVTAGTGTAANIGRPEAGKTGTSQNWRDAWFVGFTPDMLAAVWVGNDNGASMAGVTGGQLPAEIWKRFMTVAEKGLPPRDFPWLVAEPDEQPTVQSVSNDEGGTYQDEPADMGGDDQGGYGQAGDDGPPPPDQVDGAPGYGGDQSGYGPPDRNRPPPRYYDTDPRGQDGYGPPPDYQPPPQRPPARWRRESPPDDSAYQGGPDGTDDRTGDGAPPPRQRSWRDSTADGDPQQGY